MPRKTINPKDLVCLVGLTGYVFLLAISPFFLSIPGDLVPIFAALCVFGALVGVGEKKYYRYLATAMVVVAAVMVMLEFERGKSFRRKHMNEAPYELKQL